MQTINEKSPRFVRMRELINRLGRCKTTIYADINKGDFPKPIKIGRSSMWLESDVERYIDKYVAASREGGE